MSHQPTPEQAEILSAARDKSRNLLITARAGTGKTSTLEMLARSIDDPMIYLVFNSANKKEAEQRMPPNCQALTINGLGHRALAAFLGRRLKVDSDKLFKLLKLELEKLEPAVRKSFYENTGTANLLKALRHAKQNGWIPAGLHSHAEPLISTNDFFESLEEIPTSIDEELIVKVSKASFQLALRGEIDFDDQILIPAIMPVTFPTTPRTLADETQDFSIINHKILQKLVRKTWLAAVGDPFQAIYAFRGAHSDSMAVLADTFNTHELKLTVSFRCSQAVIREAHWRAPDLQWPEWAREGSVQKLPRWSFSDIPDGAAVLCRNNAPIVALAFAMLKNGRYPELAGNDIMKGLVKLLQTFGTDRTPAADLHLAIDLWHEKQKKRSRVQKTLEDRAECLHIIVEQADDLGGAIAWARKLENSGRVKLMTGHKSKGMEFDNVFILDEHLIRDREQDPNLRYVMQTRSKDRLTYIRSEDRE